MSKVSFLALLFTTILHSSASYSLELGSAEEPRNNVVGDVEKSNVGESEQVMRKRVIVRKADDAKQTSIDTERDQLAKARAANVDITAREQKILKRQESGHWQEDQQKKAQADFDNRQQRESKYLKEAKAAAQKTRKISKSK